MLECGRHGGEGAAGPAPTPAGSSRTWVGPAASAVRGGATGGCHPQPARSPPRRRRSLWLLCGERPGLGGGKVGGRRPGLAFPHGQAADGSGLDWAGGVWARCEDRTD